jgi:hypothetical protein
MKPLMLVGAFLTAAGIIGLLFGEAIHYTSHEKFPSDGPVQVITKQEKISSIPPVISGLAIAGGILLMILAARK